MLLLLILLLLLLLLLLSMMILIIGFTCPRTIHFKFITKCDKCYFKVRRSLQSSTEHRLLGLNDRRPHLDRKTRFEGYVRTIQNSLFADTIAERIG